MADVNLTISPGLSVSASVGGGITTDIGVGASNTETQYKYFTEDGTKFRQGVRDDKFVLDKALTATAWDGIEDVDWENLTESE